MNGTGCANELTARRCTGTEEDHPSTRGARFNLGKAAVFRMSSLTMLFSIDPVNQIAFTPTGFSEANVKQTLVICPLGEVILVWCEHSTHVHSTYTTPLRLPERGVFVKEHCGKSMLN